MTPVPVASPEALHYHLVSNWFWAGDQAAGLVFPLLLLITGAGLRLRNAIGGRLHAHPWLVTPLFAMAFFGLDRLCRLPVAFFWERAYESSRASTPQTWPAWLAEQLQASAVAVLLASCVATALFALCRKAPRSAWLIAGAALCAAAAAWLVLEPLSMHALPIGDSAAERAVAAVLGKAGIPRQSIALESCDPVDACPPGHVVGLGPTRRLVLNATLLHDLPAAWSVQTAAHEAKHFESDDNLKALFVLAALGFLAAWIAIAGTDGLARRTRRTLGIASVADPAALPLAVLLLGLLYVGLQPPLNAFRQHVELAADRFALELTHDGKDQGEMLAHYASEPGRVPSLSRFYLLFRATHPSDAARIALANEYVP